LEKQEANAAIIFVPAPYAKDATLEAITAKLNPVIVITEGIPVKDEMQIMEVARQMGTTVIGPNTPGIITPGQCKLGIMPSHIFKPGKVGLVSRSGTLTYEIAASLTNNGLGQTTCLGIGGDPVVGLSFVDVLQMFRKDASTKAIAMIGEIGGNAEESAAEYVKKTKYPKRIVAYIAGRAAPPGKRMGHAGAIITGKAGTAETKIEALKSAGVKVAMKPGDIAKLIKRP
jgi:succinyl-CoA synthetase alpha subunit